MMTHRARRGSGLTSAGKAAGYRPLEERRRTSRDTVSGEPARTHLVVLVLATYREMPGLSLDLRQAARLFGLRDTTCSVLFGDLVQAGHLRRSPDGRYRLTSSAGF